MSKKTITTPNEEPVMSYTDASHHTTSSYFPENMVQLQFEFLNPMTLIYENSNHCCDIDPHVLASCCRPYCYDHCGWLDFGTGIHGHHQMAPPHRVQNELSSIQLAEFSYLRIETIALDKSMSACSRVKSSYVNRMFFHYVLIANIRVPFKEGIMMEFVFM